MLTAIATTRPHWKEPPEELPPPSSDGAGAVLLVMVLFAALPWLLYLVKFYLRSRRRR